MKEKEELEFLNQVLGIASVNRIDDSHHIAQFLVDYLKDCGVDAVLQEIDSRHANVVAVLEGKSTEKVVLNGHLDTVPYGKTSMWHTNPSEPVKKNGCIYARGASDMKSGLAAMVYVLGKMKRRKQVPEKTIYFLGTCDEEKDGIGAQKLVEENIVEGASLLLIGEPTGCALGMAQKGCMWVKLNLRGVTSHGAYPQEGVNAIEYGMRIFGQLKAELEQYTHALLGTATVQVTMLKGGIVPNMTPDEAEMTLDIRVVPGMENGEVMEKLKEICSILQSETDERLRVDIQLQNDRRPIEMDENSIWLKKIEWEMGCEQLPGKQIGINYFTDASILVRDMPDIPVLLFGPGEPEMAHKPNEYVEIDKYLRYVKILHRLFS